jgi:hypothetical protein
MWRHLYVALLGSALASTAAPVRALELGPPGLQVMVKNDGAFDVVVYAYRGGFRVRVGLVYAHSQELVTVPLAMRAPGRVQLMLHPVGGGPDFLADEVTIRDGEEHAELHVTPVLEQSMVSVVLGMPRP